MSRKHCVIGIVLVVIFSWAACVNAESLTFSWTANTDSTEGYRLYMDSGDNMIHGEIPVLSESLTVVQELNGDCHNFWLRAYNGNEESGNSDIAVACPVEEDPPPPIRLDNVGGFTIVVTPN